MDFERVAVDDDGAGVDVTLRNQGTRRGTEVVQVYVRALESLVRRPDRELAGFAKATVDPGGRETVRVDARCRRLPLLGRRDACVAHRPGALRGARGRVVT